MQLSERTFAKEVTIRDIEKWLTSQASQVGRHRAGLPDRQRDFASGRPLGLLQASVELALQRPDMATEFRRYLRGLDLAG